MRNYGINNICCCHDCGWMITQETDAPTSGIQAESIESWFAIDSDHNLLNRHPG